MDGDMIRIDDTPDPYGVYGNQPEMPGDQSEDKLRQQMEREYEMSLKFAVLSIIGIIVFVAVAMVLALILKVQ